MSNVVNQLLETANPYQSVQKDAARLAGKVAKIRFIRRNF
jgi:hypothetical protein